MPKPEEPKSYQTPTPHSRSRIASRQLITLCPAVFEADEWFWLAVC